MMGSTSIYNVTQNTNHATIDGVQSLSRQEQDRSLAERVKHHGKTTGEKWFGRLRFWAAEGFILVATAAIAYVANPKYGKDKYGPIPNYLKQFTHWYNEKLLTNKIYPLGKKGDFAKRLAGAAANTTVLFWGGAAFAPFMKWFGDAKGSIVNAVNKRWGKPGEVEIGQARLKNEPKEGWLSVIKGRIGAWLVVFCSFITADTLLGKIKGTEQYKFDAFEEKFGRWVAGFTKGGKDLAQIPVKDSLTEEQQTNKVYRFGKILALDIYATTAAIFIWTGLSKFFAGRGKKQKDSITAVEQKDRVLSSTYISRDAEEAVDAKSNGAFSNRTPARVSEGYTEMAKKTANTELVHAL